MSLATSVFPSIVGIVTIPYVVDGLGKEGFGILSLAWVVLNVFAILDFGVSRATTKRVAEYCASSGDDRTGGVLWAALVINGAIGIVSAAAMVGASGWFVVHAIQVPPDLEPTAVLAFRLLALCIPALLASGVLRSALEGAQRFDLTSLVLLPANALSFLLPAVVLALGGGLLEVIMSLCAVRLALVPVLAVCCRYEFLKIGPPRFDRAEAAYLLRLGRWFTVSALAGPILLNLDRFLVGSLLGVRSVALYSAPYELVSRLTMLPASVMAAMFPVLSGYASARDDRLRDAYWRTTRLVLLVMTPVCALLVALAPQILQIWLGAEFAAESSGVVQVLALGLLAISVGSLPFNVLQASGRPDLPARIHAAELLPYAGLAWLLVSHFGILGAAAAWTIRASIDAGLLHVTAIRLHALTLRPARATWRATAVFSAIAGLAGVVPFILDQSNVSLTALVGSVACIGSLYTVLAWRYILDDHDKTAARQVLMRRVPDAQS